MDVPNPLGSVDGDVDIEAISARWAQSPKIGFPLEQLAEARSSATNAKGLHLIAQIHQSVPLIPPAAKLATVAFPTPQLLKRPPSDER